MSWLLRKTIQSSRIMHTLTARRVHKTRKKLLSHSNSERAKKCLYIDVSVIAKNDARTGIQRVVRAVVNQLISDPPNDWDIVLISATKKQTYHKITWSDKNHTPSQRPIIMEEGDVFLGLDFSLDSINKHRGQLGQFKSSGAQLWFVMYDLLPQQRPEWFSHKLVVRYRTWLATLASLADGFFCISPSVETDLISELHRLYNLNNTFKTKILPLGWDLSSTFPSTGLPPEFQKLLETIATTQTALMVGTIEPRKGHVDILDAYERLWAKGYSVNLIVAGRPGWSTDKLQRRLRDHPRNGRNLFWLEAASDEALKALYTASNGVIVASYAEGFGLPLIEALGYGTKVLARDIPVFRMHEKRAVTYFPAMADAATLENNIVSWISDRTSTTENVSQRLTTWAETTEAIITELRDSTQKWA